MSCLPKPVLRGHAKRFGIKMIISSFGFGSVISGAYYLLVAVPRKNAYLNFLKTYDPEAHYKDMVAWGYIQTANAIRKKE